MKIRLNTTVETRIAFPHDTERPLKALNLIAQARVSRHTEHVHTDDNKNKFIHENWRIGEGSEVDVSDAKAKELIDLGYAEAI